MLLPEGDGYVISPASVGICCCSTLASGHKHGGNAGMVDEMMMQRYIMGKGGPRMGMMPHGWGAKQCEHEAC